MLRYGFRRVEAWYGFGEQPETREICNVRANRVVEPGIHGEI